MILNDEKFLKTWRDASHRLSILGPQPENPAEYYYLMGVVDICKFMSAQQEKVADEASD